MMKKILVAATVMLFGYISAYAEGTEAGTSISNSASLSYAVSGVAQTAVNSNTDTFVVDKKIDFAMANNDGDQIVVVPGQSNAETTWSFRNEGNMDQNFTFTAADLAGATVYGDADTQDTDALTLEYNNGGVWAALTTLEIAQDTNITIRIRADIGNGRSDGDVMNVQLKAVAVDSAGVAETATAGSDTQGGTPDIVLAEEDTAAPNAESNVHYNGETLRWGGYIVNAPKLDLTKSSCVHDDPVNGTTNPKRIPGATIVYVFDINNTSTTTDATDVNLTDDFSDDLTTAALSRVWKGTTAVCECNDGEDHGDAAVGGGGADDTANVNASTNAGTNVMDLTGISITQSTHTCIAVTADIE
jgi:hypothetical protein